MLAMKSRWRVFAALVIAAACGDVEPTTPTAQTIRPAFNVAGTSASTAFCNEASIRIPGVGDTGPAGVFPSELTVTGAASTDFKVTVTLNGLTHSFASDLDIAVVSPSGVAVMLLSDAGQGTAGAGNNFMNTDITFDDDATLSLPTVAVTGIPSGTYRTTYQTVGDDFVGGVPAGPFNALLSTFAAGDPNGVWQLYVWDDATGDSGLLDRGWCVNITSANVPPSASHGGPYAADEGSPITFDGSGSSDPDNAIVSYTWEFGDGSTGTGPNPEHVYADNGDYTVRLTVTTDDGASSTVATTATVANVAPQVTGMTLHPTPIAVGTPIEISASFTDVGTGDSHSASWDLGPSGAVVSGTVAETGGSGVATAVVTYTQPGVYTITASITDDDGATGTRSSALSLPAYIVVYDPTAGYVTGGGWINSPAGAYVANPALTGHATFGFVAKYLTGSSVPSGNTQFHFRVGDLRFSSTKYEWLVVASAKAKYKGEGTVNGVGGYGFMLTAGDGDVKEPPGADSFRIRIWNLATGVVVYDNLHGASEDSYSAGTIAGGSITIHK